MPNGSAAESAAARVLPDDVELTPYLGHAEDVECFSAGTPCAWSTEETLGGTLLINGDHYVAPVGWTQDDLWTVEEFAEWTADSSARGAA